MVRHPIVVVIDHGLQRREEGERRADHLVPGADATGLEGRVERVRTARDRHAVGGLFDVLDGFAKLGVKTTGVSLDLKKMMASKDEVVSGLTQGIEKANFIVMPIFGIILLYMVFVALNLDGAMGSAGLDVGRYFAAASPAF